MRSQFAVAVLGAILLPASLRAAESAGFVVLLGRDTLSVEQVHRSGEQIRGEYVIRSPRTTYRTYTADLAPDGTIRRFELISRNLDGGPGPAETRSTIVFTADSAVTTAPRGDGTITTRLAAGPGAVPSLQSVMGLIEQLGRQARASRDTSYAAALVSPGARQASRAELRRAGGDTLMLMVETTVGRVGPWILRVDDSGRLLSYSGQGSAFQGEMRRADSVDVAAARTAFAHRPLGQLSTRDTARAVLGNDTLWVDYGRPSKRGRQVFGNVVPWDVVWRTGANAATQFRTPVDLEIGGAMVPAGLYSVWSLPSPSGWKLILNRQTGQWGTEYHAEQDLVRVDLPVETLAEPVELFTMAIEPKGDGAVLRLSWDRTRASLPIARRK